MKIAHADLLRLIEAVEDGGGEHLDEACTAKVVTFKSTTGKNKGKVVQDRTTGCNQDTLFEIPYDPTETVAVPEPILEPDPERAEWTDANDDVRATRRARKDENGEVITATVIRKGKDAPDPRSTVRACALDDNVGMWPRFAGTMQDERSK